MVSNTELNDNYKAISQLPIVKQTLKCVSRLTKENKALVKENAMLKKMIDRLFDRQSVSTKTCCCGCSNANRPIPDIQIKKEKVVVDMTHNTTSSHTDENIVYELSEDTDNNLDNKPIPYIIEEEDVEVEVEESAEEEEVEVEVEESAEEEEVEVEVDESDEEEEVEVEVEESDEEEEVEVEVEESDEEVEVEVEESDEEEEVEESAEEEEVEVEESAEEEEVEVEESDEEEEVEVEESDEEEEVEVEESAEEEEEEVEVEESAEEEEVEVEESDEEEDEEVYEITIKNKSYYTSNETDGPIYAITDDEDIGDQIGEFVKGKPTFYKKTNK